jgi:ABC-type lipoprotein export system ATPase subunit
LSSVEIYDAECARIYTNEENQVLYAPPILALFDGLIAACGRIEEAIKAEIANLPSRKPIAPLETVGTKAAEWYSRLSATTTKGEIESCCAWDETAEKDLTEARRRLAEPNPADQAKRLREQSKAVGGLAARLSGYHTDLGDDVLQKIEVARTDSAVKRKAADDDAKKVFENAPLEGVGTESWKLLWEAARAYAAAKAYPEEKFPNVSTEAHCVLCQQELGDEAKVRLSSFESFVKGSLETAAKAAEQRVSDLLNGLPKLDTAEALELRLAALKIEDESVLNGIRQHHNALRDRLDAVLKSTPMVILAGKAAITKLSEIASGLETQAETIDKDDQKDVRKELAGKEKELAAQKWLSEQKVAVLAEYDRLVQVKQLEEAKKLTRTNQLSEKKGALTEEIITQEFIKRFKVELKALSASRLQVEIVQTKTTKGQVWCQLRLKGASIKCKAGDVLSEGEQRIVSLAAFLADCEGSGSSSTFIFDDPISSLDQDYEEATVKRLVELSKKRQVIVFTHRISLLTLIQEEAKAEKQKLNLVGLKRESWGTGEPGDCPGSITKPGAVLNSLLSDRLAKARKAFANDGIDVYNPLGKALCGDVRNTVEALIEFTLIDGVVLRFRRGVQTKQIHSLARVTAADCKLVEDFMTKYSCFEHSQPVDLPVTIPEPDEIEADLKKLIEWHKEFTSRT